MKRKKLELIQFSRAFVPFMVMMFHLSESMMDYYEFNLFGFSYIPISGGVNYFFALSGFMMYYIYHKNFGQSHQLKIFLINRFIRIYPLYWLLTCLYLIAIFLYPTLRVGHETNLDTLITSFLLIQSPKEIEPILIVAWSLVHTVFFYFVFSLLFLPKVNLSRIIIAIWALLTIAFYYGYLYIDHYLMRFFFNQYNLIFLAGLCSAYIITHFKVNIKLSIFMLVIGIIGFPVIWLNSIHEFIPISFDTGTGLASALIILGFGSLDMQIDMKIPRVFNYIGNAAFAIYLSHNFALDFLTELFSYLSIYDSLGGWLTSIVLLLLMLVIGCLVHSFIEKPLVQLLNRGIVKKKNALVTPMTNLYHSTPKGE
ncbi:acyltransferase family protein [Bacillus tuaregi]|uniref:acyltransferase family protein n=1 Tax=Bacillus tuaregi TaxID=1816695 RepID=UPI0008F8E821|nr:acyltransferase [Bacillus tuaregi]